MFREANKVLDMSGVTQDIPPDRVLGEVVCTIVTITRWLVVLRDHTNYVYAVVATVYLREQGLWYFRQKLNFGDGREHPREARTRAPITCGEGPRLSME